MKKKDGMPDIVYLGLLGCSLWVPLAELGHSAGLFDLWFC